MQLRTYVERPLWLMEKLLHAGWVFEKKIQPELFYVPLLNECMNVKMYQWPIQQAKPKQLLL